MSVAKEKYLITAGDLKHVTWYLHRALQTYRLEYRTEPDAQAERNLRDYLHDGITKRPTVDLAAALNGWCEEYLSTEDWKKLKAAVRKRRQRSQSATHTLTVSDEVYSKLKRLASRDHVTYDEALDSLLTAALRATRPIKKKVTK